MKKSQNQLILEYLKRGYSLTPLEALNMFKCFRLASRISDLKKEYPRIEKTMVGNNGKKFASYRMRAKQDLFE